MMDNFNDLAQFKAAVKEMLSQTDYTQLPDVNIANKSDFVFYRESLRVLYDNNVFLNVMPSPPVAVWSAPTQE